jgi:hypothetical protein
MYVCIIYFDRSMQVHITAAALVWHRPAALVIHGRKLHVFPSFSEKLCKNISHPEALDSIYQGCGSGSGSVLDPYSIGSVDPDPDPYSKSGSGSRRAKKTHKSRKKLVKVHGLKCWMASFES